MRIQLNLPRDQVEALDKVRVERGGSRSALVREAIREYLAREQATELDRAFGLWRDAPVDGVKWQQQRRREWE